MIVQSLTGPETTTIKGTGNGPVVQFINNEEETTILRGFTITGGSGEHPGIYCRDSSPTIMNNIISKNIGTVDRSCGGGIALYSSSAVIMYNIITENSAEYGAGIYGDNNSTAKITKNRISKNTAKHDFYAQAGAGGGVYCYASSPQVSDNFIMENTAQFGGGVYVFGGRSGEPAEPIIIENEINNNTANFGGGIFVDNEAKPQISHNLISGNQVLAALGDDEMGGGGGIYICKSDPLITDNQIVNNQAELYGGGIYCHGGEANAASPVIKQNKINNNSTQNLGGGLFFDHNPNGSVLVAENEVNYNISGSGGGIYISDSAVSLLNNRFMYNKANSAGGGLFVYKASAAIYNNEITYNTA
ncbi:MAG: right-handed parallel beta-helix repeat-containing protein, partial [Planctomycetes bacterium]|nr:right-handed parallel beta-helix repeat-containing protein [Planctomycetota bacterium]